MKRAIALLIVLLVAANGIGARLREQMPPTPKAPTSTKAVGPKVSRSIRVTIRRFSVKTGMPAATAMGFTESYRPEIVFVAVGWPSAGKW